ncbi:MAG: SET domain-containing protein [Candidatus Tectimicrobiota bacterium]
MAYRALLTTHADRRRLARIRVSPSPIHALGLFAVTSLPEGERILPYRGEKITKDESERRIAAGNAYIFAFNERYDIDGQALDNTARYVNHSCAPNCYTLANQRSIWIVALRDILPGEELTYNYGYGPEEYEECPCHCGATQCCGYMLDPRYWHCIKRTV